MRIQFYASDLKFKEQVVLTGLPRNAAVEYAGILPNGTSFAIFRPEADWDYHDFSLVVGLVEGGVEEVKILNVTRYRDGGTTDIETKIGNFHFPTPLNAEAKPTFEGNEITLWER